MTGRNVLGTALLCSMGLQAQLAQRPSVQAVGTATISVPPDQAKIDINVYTTGISAQDAASKNATQVAGLMGALGQLLGAGADIKTAYYSVYPVYSYPQNTIVNYAANSSVDVTIKVLAKAGPVIDTAVASGATSIGGISFSLADPEPSHLQALGVATQLAMSHAMAMATASGHIVGMIRSVQEGTIVAITPIYAGVGNGPGAGGGAATTVQPGLIQVTANVTLVADLN